MEEKYVPTMICRPDDISPMIREKLSLSPDHACLEEGKIFILFGQHIICLPDDPDGNELAYTLTHGQQSRHLKPLNKTEFLEKVLNEPDFRPDTVSMKDYGIQGDRIRICAVFRAYSPLERDLCSILSAMAPIENHDAVIPISYQKAVFIKDLEGQSSEEMQEFSEALIGTMEYEGIVDIRVGIGRECTHISGLRNSYLEGDRAIDLGMRYHGRDHTFVYAKQTLERIVDSIPPEKKKTILQIFFSGSPANRLSDEILETVRVFFMNDLNLTAASKQLYIHRNTLNYRLDKIKKDYGLDLRSFQDAVIFRIISEISNEAQNGAVPV